MMKAATFMLTENLIIVLENLSKKTGLSKSDIIRRSLEMYENYMRENKVSKNYKTER